MSQTLMQALNALEPNYSGKTATRKKEKVVRIVRDWLESQGEVEAAQRLQNELYVGE